MFRMRWDTKVRSYGIEGRRVFEFARLVMDIAILKGGLKRRSRRGGE
jgi:hypothetical protein